MFDLVGESLAGMQLSMVLTPAPIAWLLVDLALLETFGFGILDFQFDRVLREAYTHTHTLAVYGQKGSGMR